MKNSRFSESLIDWYTERKRELPWRKTKDPYNVWLSEIILQQTRVDQGLPYYERFVEAFPTINDLASAPEKAVLRLWQGLGYYSRARNLHTTAKFISEELDGVFPNTYKEILKLKGVGPYTAAAIASICFNEARPVVDGNVFRFASRYFLIEVDIMKAKSRKVFEEVLSAEISQEQPGSFNQAMMEFGATVCTPTPKCEECPFAQDCVAKGKNVHLNLPIKTKKLKIRERYFHYLIFSWDEHYLLKERSQKDIWSGLFDFPLIEGEYNEESILNSTTQNYSASFSVVDISESIKHILSHQHIFARFYLLEVDQNQLEDIAEKLKASVYSREEVLTLPKPKLIVNYLSQIGIKH